jgi:hypothetical protein
MDMSGGGQRPDWGTGQARAATPADPVRGLFYAFVRDAGGGDADLVVKRAGDGLLQFLGWQDELPEDTDFGGLEGLVAFDGRKLDKAAACPAYLHPDDWQDDWDYYLVGEWRRMTTAEAVQLGLLEADRPPIDG